MINDVTLISIDDIKEVTSISKNIDPSQIEPYISIAEELYVYCSIGQALSTELKNQVTGNTLTTLNHSLIYFYIRPLVAWGAWYEASTFLNIKMVQKGLVKQSSSDSENISLEEFDLYKKSLKDKIKFFQDRLTKYLDDNTVVYPLYRSCKKNDTGFNNGIYLGKSL